MDADQCRVASGQWVAPFTGALVTDPRKLDIDHLVPLANSYRSGGHAWITDRKRAYANDLDNPVHFVAVKARSNRSNGAKGRGPEEWRPPTEGSWCQYATDWVGIKVAWKLRVAAGELEVLDEMVRKCTRPQT